MSRGSHRMITALTAVGTAALLVGAAVSPAAAEQAGPLELPRLAPASPSALLECESLSAFQFDSTVIASASIVAAGVLANGGQPIGEHCLVEGRMNERVSPVDGQTYAIGFEMRLPTDWSGRYLYQANGGTDGRVVPATGSVAGESALQMGFAVISSDAGHDSSQNPLFGLDPQARLDYGYQAVGTLTPMAKALITAAYGRGPDRSYMYGTSNGGRHTMVGSARYPDDYDGFLAGAPGFNLPQAAVAQIWGAQQWAEIAATDDLSSAFTPAERTVVANAILERCDRMDGLEDGMVQASDRCQKAFSIDRDVPTCDAERDGTCLTAQQKSVVSAVFAGATTSDGEEIYSSFPFDPGIVQSGWANWKFSSSISRDPGAVGFIFTSPPADAGIVSDLEDYALDLDIDAAAAGIYATDEVYTESSMSFMTPPDPTKLDTLRDRGGKMIVIQGTSDGVFSPDDTEEWFEALEKENREHAEDFVRFFEVPGMGHSRGGPATDQYPALAALIAWVEQGQAPDRLVASLNPSNTEVPADWPPTRTRPLCVFPAVATYTTGDPESAASFVCAGSDGTGGAGAR
ncbi:tannase/feruloyl esterase family alpha/beta hydrolase [Agromyces bauzanensis]